MTFILKWHYLRRPGVAIFADIIKIITSFIEKILKDSIKVLKKLQIMYQNATYICISWYSKICWFRVKKCWCQWNWGGVSRDSYIFWIFFRQGIIIHCRICVTDFSEGAFLPPPSPIREQPWKCPSWIRLSNTQPTLGA